MLQVLYEADGRPQVFNLTKDEATIGRSNDNDIVLNDFSVSRRHAMLRREGGGWVIHDNQSTNGVRINDKLVASAKVADGASATVGTFVLRFREEVAAPPPRPRASRTRRPPASGRSRSSTSTSAWRRTSRPAPIPRRAAKRAVLDAAYKNRVFEILIQVAKTLISVPTTSRRCSARSWT